MNTKLKSRFLTLTSTALLVLLAGTGQADDTDIFYAPTVPLPPGTEPLVMFSLDYRPNLTSTVCKGGECDKLIAEGLLPAVGPYTFFQVLRAVLTKVMDPLEGVRVGLMVNHNNQVSGNGLTEAKCSGPGAETKPGCSNGGYMALGFGSFVAGDTNGNKAAFHKFLADMPLPKGAQAHSYQGKELFFEFHRYLTGQGIYNGHVGYNDFDDGTADPTINMDVETPDIDWDAGIESGVNYISPLTAGGSCTKVFSVNLLFQVANHQDGSDNAIKASPATGGMGLPAKQLDFPSVIEWLNDVDLADGEFGTAGDLDGKQNVTSYFIVSPKQINTKTTAYAVAGGTNVPLPLDEDPEKLISTLNDIFKQILSVSTTFVAASVPVNVFNRAEVVDNIYLALFQADDKTRPYWPGNVKKLRIAGLGTNPQLVDVNDQPAIAADGRIKFDALTFWTDASALPDPDVAEGEVAGKDGRSVLRGGAGQKVPGYVAGGPEDRNSVAGARQLFYDEGTVLASLDADVATATALQGPLGAVDATEALALIKYARGLDVDDLDGDTDVDEARSWLMSDPLHSRPLPINYGTADGYSVGNPAIYLAVASNDGFMRFIRNTTVGGSESGQEMWGFMPQAVMGEVKTLRANAAGVRHPYLTDGAPVAYLEDSNNNGSIDAGEDAWLFFGLRRGGKAYYAMDISDPDNPKMLWKIEKGGDFAELGYTFSAPRLIKIDTGSGRKPALIFGGGYDLNKDTRGAVGTDDTEGTAIFVVDAKTGKLIWKAVGGGGASTSTVFYHSKLVDSVPSTVSLLDSDGDQLHDRAYVGDTGGNVWRIDMLGTDTGNWKLSLLAQVGRHDPDADGKDDDKRFFHRPDVVQMSDEDGPFDAVVIGSGDRTDPLDDGGKTDNWEYMIKDRAFTAGSGADTGLIHSSFGDVTDTCLLPSGDCTADLTAGWALELEADGEKALSTATTLGGTVYFSTYLPPGAAEEGKCGPSEGTGRLYAVSLSNGSARNNYDTTTEDEERFEELSSRGIPAEIVTLPPDSILRPDLEIEETNAPVRIQTYWFEAEDSDL